VTSRKFTVVVSGTAPTRNVICFVARIVMCQNVFVLFVLQSNNLTFFFCLVAKCGILLWEKTMLMKVFGPEIKMDLRETVCVAWRWIELTQDHVQWQGSALAVLILHNYTATKGHDHCRYYQHKLIYYCWHIRLDFLNLSNNEIKFPKYTQECGSRKSSDNVMACMIPITHDQSVSNNKRTHPGN
jgi:hypothetical protein